MSVFDAWKWKIFHTPDSNDAPSPEIPSTPEPILREAIGALQKNAIEIVPMPTEEAASPDASKLGGKPYLPADFVWPTSQSTEDGITYPLSFFCQINLAEVMAYDADHLLPKRGMLYFFFECGAPGCIFEPADRSSARVFYFEDTDGFTPLALPDDLEAEYVIQEIAIQFQAQKSYPCIEEFSCFSDLPCTWDAYNMILQEFGAATEGDPENHRMLGYADVIQEEMLTECEQVSRGIYCGNSASYESLPEETKMDIKQHAQDWILLLQLSTIIKDDFEWMFGDCGMLYFYIRKDDLAARSFDNVHFSLQCG